MNVTTYEVTDILDIDLWHRHGSRLCIAATKAHLEGQAAADGAKERHGPFKSKIMFVTDPDDPRPVERENATHVIITATQGYQ